MSMFEFCTSRYEMVGKFYVNDINALTEEQFGACFAGKARTARDITHEVIFVNDMVTARLTGAEVPKWPWEDGWATHPNPSATKEQVIAEFQASHKNLLDAFTALGEEGCMKEIETPRGPSNPVQQMIFASFHMNYHDAQLSYIQQLNGDLEMHWD